MGISNVSLGFFLMFVSWWTSTWIDMDLWIQFLQGKMFEGPKISSLFGLLKLDILQ